MARYPVVAVVRDVAGEDRADVAAHSDSHREHAVGLDYLAEGWLEELDVAPEEMNSRLEEPGSA
jgi:hypothetical protein